MAIDRRLASLLLIGALAACGGDSDRLPESGFAVLRTFDDRVASSLVVDDDGNVTAASRVGIVAIDTDGRARSLLEIPASGNSPVRCRTSPEGLVRGPDASLFFMVTCIFGQVYRLEASGTLTTWAAEGIYSGWGSPAVDDRGRLVAVAERDSAEEWGSDSVVRFAAPRVYERSWNFGGLDATALTAGPGGNIWALGYPIEGPQGVRMVLRLTDAGTETLRTFNADDPAGQVTTGIAVDASGRVVGVNAGGAANGFGSVWRMAADGTSVEVLHAFDRAGAIGRPLIGLDGLVYGVIQTGGTHGNGAIYRIEADGTMTELHAFSDRLPPPAGPLVQGADGTLHGTLAYSPGQPDKGPSVVYRFRLRK